MSNEKLLAKVARFLSEPQEHYNPYEFEGAGDTLTELQEIVEQMIEARYTEFEHQFPIKVVMADRSKHRMEAIYIPHLSDSEYVKPTLANVNREIKETLEVVTRLSAIQSALMGDVRFLTNKMQRLAEGEFENE